MGPPVSSATFAAIATELLFWVAAAVGGWTIYASRKALWTRLTGRAKPEMETA
jgi:hypothetical protein